MGRIFDRPGYAVVRGRPYPDLRRYAVVPLRFPGDFSGVGGGNGGYIFNENNLYTQEAIDDYLAHLNEGGVLSITRYFKHDEAIRLANTILAALEKQGIQDGHQRLVAVLENGPRERATLLLKNGRFMPEEVEACAAAAKSSRDFLLYAPGIGSERLYQSAEADTFRSLIVPAEYGLASRAVVVATYPKNITPSTDDRPFFFFTLRLTDVFNPDMTTHGARRMALPLLYGSVLFLGLVAAATGILPLALSRKGRLARTPGRGAMLVYFACLGAGFMLVEMALIHRVTVFLGYPTYALVVVLTTILCAGGLGSLTAGRWASHPQPGKLLTILAVASSLLIVFAFTAFDRLIALMWLPDAARIALAVAAVAMPGYLMGMCFPLGLPLARVLDERLVAWSWGVNGAFSVLGSSLSLVLALNLGLKATLLCGAGCYVLAAVAVTTARRAIPRQMLKANSSHSAASLSMEDVEAARRLEQLAVELETQQHSMSRQIPHVDCPSELRCEQNAAGRANRLPS